MKKDSTKMKLSIKTVVLKEMVSRAIKGAGQNKLLPITSLMAIQLKNHQLTLITTDASNTLYVMQDKVDGDDFYCVVQVDQFSKLISKLTSENTTLTVEDAVLEIKANGTYKLELPLDENGQTICYPDPVVENKIDGEMKEINLPTVKNILTYNKAALSSVVDAPEYTGYYCGERVVTTDMYKACGLDVNLFDVDVLLSADTMNLLDVMTEEKIGVLIRDDMIQFVSNNCVLFAYIMDGIEDYAIDAINGLLEEEFESRCKLSKTELLALLDRIALFVDVNDNKAVTLTFTDKGVDVSSTKSNGVETIEYLDSKNFKPYTCSLDINLFTQQIKAHSSDSIELQYGNDKSVKIVEEGITQVLAIMQDD